MKEPVVAVSISQPFNFVPLMQHLFFRIAEFQNFRCAAFDLINEKSVPSVLNQVVLGCNKVISSFIQLMGDTLEIFAFVFKDLL